MVEFGRRHHHDDAWPELTYASWHKTAETLQLMTQIAGKVRLGLTPWINHSWQVPLYVSARGLGTSPIPVGHEILEIEFDFILHRLVLRMSNDETRVISLAVRSVSDFWFEFVDQLSEMGIAVDLRDFPSELPNAIPFPENKEHASYDRYAAHRFWRVLVQADRVFKHFRSGFLGKASPVHFFWGGFDLAVTRFSGRDAPVHPGGIPGLPDAVTREAYSHEVSSAGFWPGNDIYPHAAFYSYAYPEPEGYRACRVTKGAYFDEKLGEFLLPYDVMRGAGDPDALLLDFLSSTYAAAADSGKWDRAALECETGAPGRVRPFKSA